MNINYQDKGKYFRGLLILSGKDKVINTAEREEIMAVCKKLGYEKRFCDQAISEFLDNKFIDTTPPKFSTKEVTMSFLKDAIKLSIIDNDLHTEELEWLQSIAVENGISNNWLDNEMKLHIRSVQNKMIDI